MVSDAQRPGGPQYMPGRRRFEGGRLDAVQLNALCRLIGTAGMARLGQVVLEQAVEPPAVLRGVLHNNKDFLANLAMIQAAMAELATQAATRPAA